MTDGASPRAVVFDVGGVLIHPDPDVMARCVGAAAGVTVDPRACAVSLQLASDDAYRLGVTDADPRVLAMWAERLGIPPAAAPAAWRAWQDADLDLWTRVDPDAEDVLAELRRRGLRLGILSNANGDLEETLVRLGLREPFSAVIDSGTVGIAKPDPRIFALGAEALGVGAAECWYVGDSLAEVDAAVDCGYGRGVCFTVAGADTAPPRRHAAVARLSELTALLDTPFQGV